MGLRLLALTLLLAGCSKPAESVQEAGLSAGHDVAVAQVAASEAVAPVVTAAQDAAAVVVEALPVPESVGMDARIVAHIVRWEVTSQAAYTRRYQGIICPGGASGPTWGVGYDGGHQSQAVIRADWAMRSDVDRLASTSGMTGVAQCNESRRSLLDVRVPFAQASKVLGEVTLPRFRDVTRRAYPGIEDLGPMPEGALTGNTYNRGASMIGSRAKEKRYIRDVCIPAKDVDCIATQLAAQCRIWAGTPNGQGLCARRQDEARLAKS